DGPQDYHDENRPMLNGESSYKLALNNLEKVLEIYHDKRDKVLINAVISTQKPLEPVVEWLKKPPVDQVYFLPNPASRDLLEDDQTTGNAFPEEYEYYLAVGLLSKLHIVEGLDVSKLVFDKAASVFGSYWQLNKGGGILPDVFAPSGPCIPGKRKLFIDVNGDFRPCEKVSEVFSDMLVGDVDKGFDYEKLSKMLNLAQKTADRCRQCPAFRHCTLCERAAIDDPVFSPRREAMCRESVAFFRRKMRLYALVNEARNLYYRGMKPDDPYESLPRTVTDPDPVILPQKAIFLLFASVTSGGGRHDIIEEIGTRLEKDGYHTLIVSRDKKISQNRVDLPVFDKKDDGKVYCYNAFWEYLQLRYQPEIILLDLSQEGLMIPDPDAPFGFGIENFTVLQSVSIDYTVLEMCGGSYENPADVVEKIGIRYGIPVDSVVLNDRVVDLEESSIRKEVIYRSAGQEELAGYYDELKNSLTGRVIIDGSDDVSVISGAITADLTGQLNEGWNRQ
nr:hypothetical protein [Lachnospiraceae bacterium]